MFPVWKKSPDRPSKSWVYAVRAGGSKAYPLELLFRERVVNDRVGSLPVVVVADPATSAVRAYERGNRRFAEGPTGSLVEPESGQVWDVLEEGLRARTEGKDLARVAGHRAYWFGWYAFFPDPEVYEGCAAEPAGGS